LVHETFGHYLGIRNVEVVSALMGASLGIYLPHCWCMAIGGALILVT